MIAINALNNIKSNINKEIKKVALTAIKRAGKFLLKEYKDFNRADIKFKSHHEIITKNDLLSEEIIIKEIKNNFSDHRILSEERGRIEDFSKYLWIIDPIDGTTNFSMHNPLWSISIAVAYEDEVILGAIYAPFIDELFISEKGKGSVLNGEKINVSKIGNDKVLNTFCHSTNEKDIKRAIKYFSYQKINGLDCRQLGSAAIELAYVACGRIESIMIPGANSWDVAAGALLVREAGGKVTDFLGKEWNLESKDILASNKIVHKDILEVIKK